jgi:GNAT superfamily N-acetyltransferase
LQPRSQRLGGKRHERLSSPDLIRRAGPGDAEAAVHIFRESRAEAMPWLPVLHTEEEDLNWFRGTLAGEAYVFEEDGVVLGYAVLQGDELHDLYVVPESQRRGVGSALFARVREARPDGFHFWAFRDNIRARRFYDARGCRVIGASDGDNEEGMPDVQYEWRPTRAEAEA